MIKVYTSVDAIDEQVVHKFMNQLDEQERWMLLPFPETTTGRYGIPIHPEELMHSFRRFIHDILKSNKNLIVITYSTLIFDIIRLSAKDRKMKDVVEVYEMKNDGTLTRISSVDENGRMGIAPKGIFDAEARIVLKLV